MNVAKANGVLSRESSYAGKTQKTAVNKTSFTEQLQVAEAQKDTFGADIYQEYLRQRYGNVIVQSVEKGQNSMDRIGAKTAGTGNVIIAPNILKQMADDPKVAAYYEGKIQHYFDSLPRCQAQLSMMGHEIHSSGVVIHPDGTVTYYVSGDLKPEVRARIEAQIKAESEAKAKRKQMYQEAAKKWSQEMEISKIYQTTGRGSIYAHRQ